jgi:pyruvate,water dikinase
MPDILHFNEITDATATLVGGKGLSLGKTASAGLPVPDGFVITTQAYRRLAQRGIRSDPGFVRAITTAYEALGGGLVAVRSSATAEDAADTSFAGQQETILGVKGPDPLLDAIERCWQSLFTERAIAYREKQNVDAAGLAMAVVVQKLVPAESAGVLFTRDPLDPTGKRMLAEASWGLGEVVVSGRVQPDRFTLACETGEVLSRSLGSKAVRVVAGVEEHVPPEQQRQFCLGDAELAQLTDLGRKVEAFYSDARDVEWAYAGGAFHLLQARPITVAGAAEREQVRRSVITELKAKASPRGTVWVRYNLSEVLPKPTPMTWAVVQRLLAADGGFGAMNRDLGARPDPALGSLSGFDLVAGRPMANLSRLPHMQFAQPPFEYPLGEYRKHPNKALDPKPALNPFAGKGCFFGALALPGTILNLTRLMNTTKKLSATFAQKFESEVVPGFAAAAKQALGQDWSKLEPPALVSEFRAWVQRTLVEFARESLKATVFADLTWNEVFETLKPKLGEGRARIAVGELSLGAAPPEAADLPRGVRDLEAGNLSRAAFLEQFGHRGTNEMELAQPRWAEVPHELDKLVRGASGHEHTSSAVSADTIANEAKLAGPFRDQLAAKVVRLRTFLGLREAGKHYLLMGYAVIRRALLELDRRMTA